MERIITRMLSFLVEYLKLYLISEYSMKNTFRNRRITMYIAAGISGIIGIVSAFSSFFESGLSTLLFGIVSILLLVFSIEEKKRLLIFMFEYICICCMDMLVSGMVVACAGISSSTITGNHWISLAVDMGSLCFLLLLRLIKAIQKSSESHFRLDVLPKGYLVIFLIGGLMMGMGLTYFQSDLVTLKNKNLLLLFMMLAMLAYLIACFLIVLYHSRNTYTTTELEAYKEIIKAKEEYYQMILYNSEEMRKFRHDIKNHIFCMHTLFQEKEYDELEQYFVTMEQTLKKSAVKQDTGHKLLNVLLNAIMNNYPDVEVTCSGKLPNQLALSSTDICTIFSNLLSNAFEAAVQSVQKKITLEFGSVNQNIIIIITNTSSAAPIVKKGQFLTSKKVKIGHGYGISNAKTCVEQNNGLIHMGYQDGIFTSKIVFFNMVESI